MDGWTDVPLCLNCMHFVQRKKLKFGTRQSIVSQKVGAEFQLCCSWMETWWTFILFI